MQPNIESMSSFTKYTLLEMSNPPLPRQVVMDITEELFCGPAIEPIFVAVILDGGTWAEVFDEAIRAFVAGLPG